jgi:hypothetical protein
MTGNSGNTDTCGCWDGTRMRTPVSGENRPGLSALVYRAGTHGLFRASMNAHISLVPALRPLTTRDDRDPTIALLDAWATVLDVLTFYQERIANECYLRTATERRSVLEIARSTGYELSPGVAAGTYLAFLMDETKGAPASAIIDTGTKAQSTPGQDEKPQVFETVGKIEARTEWNQLIPQQTELRLPEADTDTELYLDGVTTNLKPGDALLIINESKDTAGFWRFVICSTVTPDPPAKRTKVGWSTSDSYYPRNYDTKRDGKLRVIALRLKASLFGLNVPVFSPVSNPPNSCKDHYIKNKSLADEAITDRIDLDNIYSQVVSGTWVVLKKTPISASRLYHIDTVSEETKEVEDLAGSNFKFTSLHVTGLDTSDDITPRNTVAYTQCEELLPGLAEAPKVEPVDICPDSISEIALDRIIGDLPAGRAVIVSGIPAGSPTGTDRTCLPLAVSRMLPDDGSHSIVQLKNPRSNTTDSDPLQFERSSVVIYANVAHATHGETKTEVLGNGDAGRAFQEFTLKQAPLTCTSAPVDGGAKSSLTVRVQDIAWEELPSLYGLSGGEKVYTTRIDDNGAVRVRFGDRLPTGTNNVLATYRTGIGLAGCVGAGRINLLMTRPLGVREVTNPLPAEGAQDPESRDEARENAPLKVLTLGRIVSQQDYEDFTRSFAGIGKARAEWIWDGMQRVVHITIASPDGSAVDTASDVYTSLTAAIDCARDTRFPVIIDSYRPRTFSLNLQVRFREGYDRDTVKGVIVTALKEKYSFKKRDFAQPVTASEILSLVQGIDGVVAVRIKDQEKMPLPEEMQISGTPLVVGGVMTGAKYIRTYGYHAAMSGARALADDQKMAALSMMIVAETARYVAGTESSGIQPAELLLLDPAFGADHIGEVSDDPVFC